MVKKRLVNVRTQNESLPAEATTCLPEEVNLDTFTAIQFLHEKNMARRRRKLTDASSEMFKLTCVADLPIPDEVPEDELEAEKVASHKRVILTDKDLNVIHGHESVLIAKEQGEPIVVLKLMRPLERKPAFLLQVRHSAKEGLLYPAVRMEVIRTLHDEMSLDIKSIQLLLVNPKGKKPTAKEVTSELRVGRLFEKHPGYTIPFTGFELDKHSFSNLKYLVGNNTIFNEMEKSPDTEQHFLRTAITATKTRSKRLNTEIPPLMKYDDTKELLFSQGLPQAKALLKTKYPEENYAQHPQNDLVSASAKLKNTDTILLIKHQIEKNPLSSPLLRQVIEINSTLVEAAPGAGREIMRSLFQQLPEMFADVLTEQNPDLALNSLRKQKDRYNRVLKDVQ